MKLLVLCSPRKVMHWIVINIRLWINWIKYWFVRILFFYYYYSHHSTFFRHVCSFVLFFFLSFFYYFLIPVFPLTAPIPCPLLWESIGDKLIPSQSHSFINICILMADWLDCENDLLACLADFDAVSVQYYTIPTRGWQKSSNIAKMTFCRHDFP